MSLTKEDIEFILDRTQIELQAVAEYTANKWDDQAALWFPWLRANFLDSWLGLPVDEAVQAITAAAPQQLNLDPDKWLGYVRQFIELAQLLRKLLDK